MEESPEERENARKGRDVRSLVFLVANKLSSISGGYFTGYIYIYKVRDAVYTLGVILTTANFESGTRRKARRGGERAEGKGVE